MTVQHEANPRAKRARREPAPPPAAPILRGRVPPHDLDAEAAVLSALMLNQGALDRVLELLKPEHFYSDANGRILDAARGLALDHKPVDTVSLASYLRDRDRLRQVGGAAYIAQLADATPAVAHVGAHAEIVYAKWRLRAFIAVCWELLSEAYGEIADVQTFIDRAEQAVYNLAHSERRREMRSLKLVLADVFADLVAACERGDELEGYPTGFRELDELTGGLRDGDLTILAARPGMGKTAGAAFLSLNMAHPRTAIAPAPEGSAEKYIAVPDSPGFGACFFSLEMPEKQTAMRLTCSEARVSIDRWSKHRLTPNDWNAITDAAKYLSSLPFWLDEKPGTTLLEIRAKVRRQQAEYDRAAAPGVPAKKVGLVVVDYIGLMGVHDASVPREQQVSALSRGLKQMARELNVHVLALAQLNRECEGRGEKRPQLSDLRESGALEQDADNVIFLYRDDYYNPRSKDAGIAEWIVAKCRNGKPGTVRTKWTAACTRFDPLRPGDGPEEDFA